MIWLALAILMVAAVLIGSGGSGGFSEKGPRWRLFAGLAVVIVGVLVILAHVIPTMVH